MPEYIALNVDPVETDYFKALLKWICKTYQELRDLCIFSFAVPNSAEIVLIHIYNTMDNSADGLPRYSSLFFVSVASYTFYLCNANNYIFEEKRWNV